MSFISSQKAYNDRLLFNRFMLGIDPENRVESEKYRCYVLLISVIRELLEECRINISSKGYLYIQDCIITIIDQRTTNIRFNTDVYPYVAYKYGVRDGSNIEHSIRNALVAAYRIFESEGKNNSSIMNCFAKRPTNKEFLLYLTNEVCRRLWNESIEFSAH